MQVTYREVDLLLDKDASSRQRQRVAEVVIHELAHQWFGNLVTMDWWDDLWLNEGFATWMETGVCDELYPSWHMWEQFITDMQGRALQLDALRSSHPIQVLPPPPRRRHPVTPLHPLPPPPTPSCTW